MRSATRLVLVSAVLVGGWGVGSVVNASMANAASILYVGANGSDSSNNCLVQANPCATISYAVSVATSGDTIQVGAGTYDENVVVAVSDLTITGQGPATIVTGTADQPTFELNSNGVSLTMLSLSGNRQSGGVENAGSSADFVDDTIASNLGTGITNTGDNVSISEDFIAENSDVNGNGGGINNQGNTVNMMNDTIFENGADYGGGVWNNGTGVQLVGDTIDPQFRPWAVR